jgi:hypothetical protein
MNTMYTVSKNFSSSKYSDASLLLFAKGVKTQMTDNSNFPTPEPTLDELGLATDAYELALEQVKNGGKEATSNKNDKRAALAELLKNLATYVEIASNGDKTKILSSGFEPNKLPSTVGPLPVPTGLKVMAGQGHGRLILTCDVCKDASAYLFEYTDGPSNENSVWIQVIPTKHKVEISGLTEGKLYVFRVTYIGSDPSRICSDEVSSYVL